MAIKEEKSVIDMNHYKPEIFKKAKWVTSSENSKNQYAVFVKKVKLINMVDNIKGLITASYIYKLYINGEFVADGPTMSDPRWCLYDKVDFDFNIKTDAITIAIIVHHYKDIQTLATLPAPMGLLAEFEVDDQIIATDENWKLYDLESWSQDVIQRSWALDYAEDYDSNLEPAGWDNMFHNEDISNWNNAELIHNAHSVWTDYEHRIVPYLEYKYIEPVSFKSFKANNPGAPKIEDISGYCNKEELIARNSWENYSFCNLNQKLKNSNVLTFDLGKERVGYYFIELESDKNIVIEMSGAEYLENGRPRITVLPEGNYKVNSVRYKTKKGKQKFISYGWTGLRYLHLAIRGSTKSITVDKIGCIQRKAPLAMKNIPQLKDKKLKQIFNICKRTLEICALEKMIDCPTREQAQYFGDSVFYAQSLWRGFSEKSYLIWYLECVLKAPFLANGQISSVYPMHDRGACFLDYSLIMAMAQDYYNKNTQTFYKSQETLLKFIKLKDWYDAQLNHDGLLDFNYQEYASNFLRNFIDHPGIGWHQFPHRGINRDGISCPLNIFYYNFINILAQIFKSVDMHKQATELVSQSVSLKKVLFDTFYDGNVFHDAFKDGRLSEGTSWQTNSLAVYFDIITGKSAKNVMMKMLKGYDKLCRCTPYFHFFFLFALRKVGLEREALDLIIKLWYPMVEQGSTTVWECFDGLEDDSRCHPWSTAPFLFLLDY